MYISISDAMKNGKSEGTTEFAQSLREDLALATLFLENTIKNIVNKSNEIGIKFRLILKIYTLKFFIRVSTSKRVYSNFL